jgi:signal transduction histidine kinase
MGHFLHLERVRPDEPVPELAPEGVVIKVLDEADVQSDVVRLCHDLRQFIAAGRVLSVMPAERELDTAARERLHQIQDVFAQLSDMVDATLDEGMRGSWLLDVEGLVADCVRITGQITPVELETRLDRPAYVYADPALVRRAVLNVLENASRATGSGSMVAVTVREAAGYICIEVSDRGRGFGQIPSVRGLGMAAVDQAMRQCRGRLEIASGPEPGTTVRLMLPLRDDGIEL